jgi:hypothetical protein
MYESTTRFWVDWWCGRSPLRVRFPSLFSTVVEPGAYVAMYHGENAWRIPFCRALGLSERVELIDLLRLVDGMTLSGTPNVMSWPLEPSCKFSVRSLYHKLCKGTPHKHDL